MTEAALTLLTAGIGALTELNTFVAAKSGLPLTVTTDTHAATPPCILISAPRSATFGVGGGCNNGSAQFSVVLILPFFNCGVADVLHAIDLFGGGLYQAMARAADGTRLTSVALEGIEEAEERPGIWMVSFVCEFAY